VGIKESSGGDEFNLIYLIHCSNLCKCYNVLPLSTTIKKKENLSVTVILFWLPVSRIGIIRKHVFFVLITC
jgi:hypothetical protein